MQLVDACSGAQHAQHAQPTALVHAASQAPTHGDNVFGSPVPVAAPVAAGGDQQRHPFCVGAVTLGAGLAPASGGLCGSLLAAGGACGQVLGAT